MALSDQSVSEIRETFLMFDKKGNEKVAVDLVGDVMRSCGLNPLGNDVNKFIAEVGKGSLISFEEYLSFHEECAKKGNPGSLAGFMEGWKCFDHEGNGFVGNAEVRHVLTTLGDVMDDEDVDELLAGKEDSKGMINYEEFSKFVMSG